jgi:catechol 2,3-dioxygenase-like lactoylglutathione lyase family enzyme
MLGTTPFTAFLATAQPDRARAFYASKLGLTLVADEPFALVFDLGGTPLRIQKVAELAPLPFTVLGWSVKDIRETVGALTRAGVAMERFEGMKQDELGIWSSPGGARVAWFRDPDGNTLSLTQHP